MFGFIVNGLRNIVTGGKYKKFLCHPAYKKYINQKKSVHGLDTKWLDALRFHGQVEKELYHILDEEFEKQIYPELISVLLKDLFKNWGVLSDSSNTLLAQEFVSLLDVHQSKDNFCAEHRDQEITKKVCQAIEAIIEDLKANEALRLTSEQRERVYPKIHYLESCKILMGEFDQLKEKLSIVWGDLEDLCYQNFNEILEGGLEEDLVRTDNNLSEINRKLEQIHQTKDTLSREEYLRAANIFEREYQGGPNILAEVDSVYNDYKLEFKEDFKCSLRLYQEFMVKYFLHHKKILLGDEMGLGKTIQALAAIYQLSLVNPKFKALIIVPASLMINWEREIANKTNFTCISMRGNKPKLRNKWYCESGIALTSYATVANIVDDYLENLDDGKLDILVTDESEYVKNPKAKRSVSVKALAKITKHCIYMTGTPLQNNVKEFIEIISHLDSELAEKIEVEDDGLILLSKYKFKNMVKNLYLRRNQKDVLHELPEKIETDEWIEFSKKELMDHLHDLSNLHFMQYRYTLTVNSHGKTARLRELVNEYRRAGENILVFTFFKKVIDHLEKSLDNTKQLHGQVAMEDRQKIIDSLEENPKEGQVLLCQITAIGRGLNLQNASVVIIVEPQLNPALEDQAIARSMRMGQRRSVKVHRLIASDTIEIKFTERLKEKREIFRTYAKESLAKEENPEAVESEIRKLGAEQIEYLKEKLDLKVS